VWWRICMLQKSFFFSRPALFDGALGVFAFLSAVGMVAPGSQ